MAQDITLVTTVDKHFSRYQRHVNEGKTVEEIAKADRVAVDTVRLSIASVATHLKLCNQQELEASQISIILQQHDLEMKTLREALTATIEVETTRKVKGKDVVKRERVPDHATRMNALRIINAKVEALKPNGGRGGINVQVANLQGQPNQQQQQTSVVVDSEPYGVDFESILRKSKASRQLTDGHMAVTYDVDEVIDADSPEA